ncbi:MAG: acyl-CoA thioesterase [Syntrophobacteraceae bacterium]
MEGKKVSQSRIVMAQQMNPLDANPAGNVHGGVIMRLIDTAAGVAAHRHARGNVVTASIDRLDFLRPIYIGDLVIVKASVNLTGRTSMEIGVRVEAENLISGETRKAASAYLTYVALGEDGRPSPIPQLILETDDDIRRNCEAKWRRDGRLHAKGKDGCHLT